MTRISNHPAPGPCEGGRDGRMAAEAGHWLERAAACRRTAEAAPNGAIRARLLGFAERYGGLAAAAAEARGAQAEPVAPSLPGREAFAR